jgi:hypothetical protein
MPPPQDCFNWILWQRTRLLPSSITLVHACLLSAHATHLMLPKIRPLTPQRICIVLQAATIFCNYQHIISTSKDGTLLNSGKFPLSLGSYTTIPKAPRGKPIDHLPSKYLDIVHVDIAFGNCVSIGGFKYTLIIVDQATCYNWTFGLKSLQHSDILLAFLLFWDKVGSLAQRF